MLTRFVRMQLIIFTIASVLGLGMMLFGYMQVPTLFGIGRLTVKLELPETGGLYRFSNVTYNGVQIGVVTDVALTGNGVRATLSLDRSPRIPADLTAAVRSVSAIGEQYVDLMPRSDGAPFLQNGSVIAASDTEVPQQVGPMLDQVSALVDSIPKDRLGNLLDETYLAFDGAGYDFQSLLDSAATISGDANRVSDRLRTLIDDGAPLLDSQDKSTDSIRTFARSMAGISEQVAVNDPQLRTILQRGPGFADEVSGLLQDLKPTLPILLANMNTVGQVLLTYNPSIEQLMVLLPGYIAVQQSFGLPKNNATGMPQGDFTLTFGDPNACTVGFLPPSAWRSPADTTTIDTPDGLYCKLPQDSPVSVRGARNFPCIEHPGKRAPTVELCDDPRGFVPIAMRQHLTGPGPIDPNLLKQGIVVDDRVDFSDRLFAPTEGTPLPPGAVRSGTPPDAPRPVVPAPPPQAPQPQAPPGAAPSGYADSGAGASVAVLPYDPNTGKYMTADGRYEQQTNLAVGATARSWTDLMPA
ncbi:mammalian cell entry protein [Mycolicibacter terrae]|uniref:Mammalian cell entry protein n=1 Tax=Mycolicibacter terrae TaxID=1788 RepID=A0AAD1MEC8_9MYCO|nr:MlaD family protein [Mycolicibacter terrae]ORW90815.1 virulence factor Mce [Mycolicibacter terrae]BBX21207.1 mammalian cell entry protein [Mycolicibacter terrae]SNV91139.1 MCE-family protein [Mycolicibacter terrae]